MSEFLDILKTFVVGILLVAILFAAILIALTPVIWYTCHINAELMETDYQYRIFGGCFLKTADGSYINYELYRGVDIIEEDTND